MSPEADRAVEARPLVIYHGNCPDGFGAALAAWDVMRDGADYLPASYGDAPPDVRERPVFILDFSYPRAVLQQMHRDSARLRVYDHHKTAEADLAGLDYCTFDMEKSGAVLSWGAFHSDDPTPLMLYIQDRDLWRWKLPHSKEVSAALWSYPRDFETWARFMHDVSPLADDGIAILRFKDQLVEQMCSQATWREIGGNKVPVVNASVAFSEVGEALCIKNPDAPFAAYYFDRADGKRQWGARSRNGFDVSAVAKALGGGGHAAAAGWTEVIA